MFDVVYQDLSVILRGRLLYRSSCMEHAISFVAFAGRALGVCCTGTFVCFQAPYMNFLFCNNLLT